jgi:hypothetical protein
MDGRTDKQRLDDLEHDNNLLRGMLADVQTENARLSVAWETMGRKIDRLCSTVDDFVGRFGRVQ